jgi:hypothetical protein
VLNLSDGKHSLLDIAERSGIMFTTIREAADLLHQKGLLSIIPVEVGNEAVRSQSLRKAGTQFP